MDVSRRRPVGIIGSSTAAPGTPAYDTARAVAHGLAKRGIPILCGGRGGVMEAACLGAEEGGGLSLALLPGMDPDAANPHASIVLTTDLGKAQDPIVRTPIEISRNRVIASASACLVAVSGGVGTANEIGFALAMGKTVIGLCDPPALEPDAASKGRMIAVADVEAALAAVHTVLDLA